MKFGKHIQKRQLDIPEYAASFVDYKALKKLIKKLSATPVIPAQNDIQQQTETLDPQASLQANRATFFFRLERELEKVNTFYLQKEAELRLRLKTLLDKKTLLQTRSSTPRLSSTYITLEEGFRQFSSDLSKLQQFVEVNATAFSKILKKWDKTSKSRTKELYLSRAVEVQPVFNRDVISELSDQATTNLLELSAWAEGERIQYATSPDQLATQGDDGDVEPQILQAVNAGNLNIVKEWLGRIANSPGARDRVTRVFLASINEAPESIIQVVLESNLVDLTYVDEINERNCLHEAAIAGRLLILQVGLANNIDVKAPDAYGRLPIHYACMHNRIQMMEALLQASPDTVNAKDQDNFTPLIHSIVQSHMECVVLLLAYNASINPDSSTDHAPLNLACQHGSVPIVEILLKKRPEILPDAEGLYPQHLVARTGQDPKLLLMLRDYGASLDQPDKLYLWTPLFHAASEGHVECVKMLLQCGVNVDILDEKELSAMYYAVWEGHIECIRLLAAAGHGSGLVRPPPVPASQGISMAPRTSTPAPMTMEAGEIPDLSLPPPIIPLRRYGHNFLDTKTYVVISFEEMGADAIQFYDDSKYPAARLTISSRSTDLIPRNLLLPVQEEFRVISFQIENLDTFAIEFDVFPTFGAKVIARAVASSKVFTGKASSTGHWHSELFDPRLRAIGRLSFNFQVIGPFHGIPLEITHFATYWKATSQFSSQPNALITGSSLSGEYVRLFVQLTADGIAVLYPRFQIPWHGVELPVGNLTYEEFRMIGQQVGSGSVQAALAGMTLDRTNVSPLHQALASSFGTLAEALEMLPTEIHVEIHVLYPSSVEEERLRLGPTPNLNMFADVLLTVVFDHARKLREQSGAFFRSIVFSSFNQDICTALNWKQPNYPVLLCNELGADADLPAGSSDRVQSSGRTTISVKEAVRIAQSNNFMGLICSSRLLSLVPALIESIKVAGLVLSTDMSDSSSQATSGMLPANAFQDVPEGVEGVLRSNGVLRFNEAVDM